MPRWCCVSLHACSNPIHRRLADFTACKRSLVPAIDATLCCLQHCLLCATVLFIGVLGALDGLPHGPSTYAPTPLHIHMQGYSVPLWRPIHFLMAYPSTHNIFKGWRMCK